MLIFILFLTIKNINFKHKYNISDMIINSSFSQCFEDLILNVFFFDVDNGFYIDVGAFDPNILSVTKYFYLKGWSGINIEPLRKEYENLLKERVRDININVAVGEKEGNISLYEWGAFSTTKKDFSIPASNKSNISLQTMANICKKNIPKNKEIHFCKIDVEGNEREVLLGFDFENYRPQIFCIESVVPGTEIQNYKVFEDILIKNNYEIVFAYRINRYYVDKNLEYLKERSKYIEEIISIYNKTKNKKS